MGGNRGGRSIAPDDMRRLQKSWAQLPTSDFAAVRTRALVQLALGSSLRLSECLALDLEQLLQDSPEQRRLRIRKSAYLLDVQAKGGRGGVFVLPEDSRRALATYARLARAKGWAFVDEWSGPVFVTVKGRGRTGPHHVRLSARAAQVSWARYQDAIGMREPYRFHDLRHDALTRFADSAKGNPFQVAQFGRLRDIRTALRYVHGSTSSIAELAELAQGGRR